MRLAEWGVRLLASSGRLAARNPGGIRIPGASISRDERGVPTVLAATEPDLYLAAGYAQACDRLWQMDVLRRRAYGRLSEVFGPTTLAEDLRARRLALARVARASQPLLSDRCLANLRAFSAGVNAAIRRMRRRVGLPPEFLLLRYRPEEWTPLDSLVIVKQLGFDLGLNLKYEVYRARLAAERPEHVETLGRPRYPADGPVTVRTGPAVGAVPDRPIAVLPDRSRAWLTGLRGGEQATGSNSWVISGRRSASGFPLLANDPHVLFTRPSLWYQLGLRLPGAHGYGVTVPGVPGLIAGGNASLAWGITNSTVDTQDLCTLDEDTPPDRWVADSTIEVRGSAPVSVRAAGGEQYVEFDVPTAAEPARCGLFWSGYTPSGEIEACQRMWLTRCYGEFRDALRHFGIPVLNVAVACRDGTIALKTSGRVPRRVPGSGVAPGSYAEVAASWESFLDFEELPEVVDPPEGYIVSANHRMLPPGGPIDLGDDWVAPYRAQGIEERIRATGAITPADCASWQLDQTNRRARRLLPVLLDGPPPSGPAAPCHRLLSEWDCQDRPDAAAPLVFFRLIQALGDEWLGGALGADLTALVPDLTLQLDNLVLDPAARAALGVTEPLPATVHRLLALVGSRLAEQFGDDPAGWRYDLVHRIVDPHPIGRAGPALRAVFGADSTPVGGGGHTVCLMAPNREGEVIEGAPWRFVAELAPTGAHLWDVLRHGSSGHPRSPHYADQTPAHARGELHATTLPETPAAPSAT